MQNMNRKLCSLFPFHIGVLKVIGGGLAYLPYSDNRV